MSINTTPQRRSRTRPKRSRIRLRGRDRRGAAVVEAAICFPLIILLMMGTLEICSGIYLKESLSICCFEGARAGIRRRATREMVLERVTEALANRRVTVSSGGVEVFPEDFSGLRELDTITVRITAPTQGNSLYIFDSLFNRNVSSQVVMVREFDE